ncbi:MAG TPA: VWA domain-containing protein [Candidatus Limnocylindrales bacterium]|nr:VWA domain-containing protein [Candidatus Limnocylindrales bacterium]
MSVGFDTPQALLLLIPALLLTIGLHLASRRRVGLGRRRLALVLRGFVLAFLVFALAGFRLVLPVDRLATVFVVDLSDSVGTAGREDALAWLRDSLKVMPEGDVAGIVGFGRAALVERLPQEVREIDRIATTPVRSATDIGAALRLASALFPDDAQKRIVLLSDGNDTTGSGQSEAALAAARGIQIETRAIGLGAADEVVVDRLTTPSTAKIGEELEAAVDVSSTVAQPATIRLYADGGQIASKTVDLAAGSNHVTFLVKPTETGFHTFRAVVEAGRDTFSQNNRADSDTIVNGEPRVLVLAGDEKVATELVAALKVEHQTVDSLIPEQLPAGIDGLLAWDSIVLVDVSRLRLSDAQLTGIQQYVRDFGRGLVMIGGPKSYGAGGYTDTPIEETLPVDMGVKDQEKQPDVALVVVIDKSGSMDACHCNSFNGGNPGGGTGIGGVRKVDIGKEAILRAAAAMSARDQLGVVAFDESAHWVVQTQPLGGISDLRGAIGGIQPLGQTNIFAGLDQAVTSLEGATATRRHIILLTDGWSTSGQYDAIIARMKAAGITLSTVGAGGGANPFLQQLAKQGGGRFYPAVNPASIPDIFLKETQQVAGQQIVEEPFHPILTSQSPILRGIDALPQLLGYNGTTAKSAAQTVLVTPRDDPLLAQWQYGLGRSVAWTSDSTGRWAKGWIGWNGFTKFFSQLVSWTFPGEETGGIEATFITEGNQTKLRVESVAEDGSPRDFYSTAVAITTPDLVSKAIGLSQVAPGVYEVPLGEIDPGAYVIRVSQSRPGSTPLGRTLGLVAPTPAEYRVLGTNESFLATLRSATAGRAILTAAEPWTHDLRTNASSTDLWPTLLILALLLWPLDIALRRVSIGRRELVDARRWLAGGWRRTMAPRTKEVAGMLAARDRAAGTAARAALLRRDEEFAGQRAAHVAASPVDGPASPATPGVAARPAVAAMPAGPVAATPRSTSPSAPAGGRAPSGPPSTPPAAAPLAPDEGDTLSRLRDAKRRSRER